MIAQIRKIARSFASKLLMVALIMAFGVWGVGDMLRSSDHNASVATVGEASISVIDFQRDLYRENERLRSVLGKQFTPEIAKQFGVEQRVLQRMVDNQLLIQEARALGIRISDADVVKDIRTNPAFQDDNGKFSKERFGAVLKNLGYTEKGFVQKTRDDMALKLLVSTIVDSIVPPANVASVLLAAREEQRSIELYTISPELVKNIASPSEEQLKEYYNTHSAEFSRPEYRQINYVELGGNEPKAKSVPSEKDIAAYYGEHAADFKRPERRKLTQLIFGNEESAKKAYAEIMAGNSLEQVGKSSNILNPDNLNVGLVDESGIPSDAAGKVFALKKGEVSAPIKSPFGWHVFQIKEVVPAAVAPLAEVRTQIIKELEQKAMDGSVSEKSNKLEDLIAGGSNLAEAAKELGLKVVSLPAVERNGRTESGEVEKTFAKQPKLLEAAFKTDEKTESSLIAGSGGESFILRVEKVVPEQLLPFDKVKDRLISGWLAEEKAKQLAEIASKVAADFSDDKNRAKAIAAFSLTSRLLTVSRAKDSAKNLPANMVVDVFDVPVGGATRTFITPDGGYVIAVVRNIITAKIDSASGKNSEALADLKKQYEMNVRDEVIDEYLRHLGKKYKISVNMKAIRGKSE